MILKPFRPAPRLRLLLITPLLCAARLGWAQCSGAATQTVTTSTLSSQQPLTISAPTDLTIDPGVTVYNNGSNVSNGAAVKIATSDICADISNAGAVTSGTQAGLYNQGTIDQLANLATGSISSGARRALINASGAVINTIANSGSISGTFMGLDNQGSIGSVTNLSGGTIASTGGSATDWAIINESGGTIGTLTNAGTLVNAGTAAPLLQNSSSIAVFNNAQGSGNPVTLNGNLPSAYNVVVASPASYGQLKAWSVSGTMAFDIYGNVGTTLVSGVAASQVTLATYTDVLQGFSGTLSNGTLSGTGFTVTGTSGSYGRYAYQLVADAANPGSWNLVLSLLGPTVADTNASTAALGAALSTPLTLQAAALGADLDNECSDFDQRGICVGASARRTTLDSHGPDAGAALVWGGYRVDEHLRVGGWADQGIDTRSGTASIRYGNTHPMVGAYAAWIQDPGRSGVSVRIAAGYGSQDLTLGRAVTGSAEPGTGASSLDVAGASAEVRYDDVQPRGWVATPYAGLRYTSLRLGGYTEQAGATVSDPLSVGPLAIETTTALAGVRIAGAAGARTQVWARLGMEHDVAQRGGSAAVSQGAIGTLNPMTVAVGANRTRPVLGAGASYAVARAQRIGVDVAYGESSFSRSGITTVQLRYEAGF